jgi:hypothetical protein
LLLQKASSVSALAVAYACSPTEKSAVNIDPPLDRPDGMWKVFRQNVAGKRQIKLS